MRKTSKKPPISRGDYRNECIKLMTGLQPNLFVTLAFNRRISMNEAQIVLEKFHAFMDRKIVGRAFLRRPEKRSTYIAMIEKPDANIHIHALFKMTPMQRLRFCLTADAVWKKLFPGGNVDLLHVYCAQGAADYITKELQPQTSDRLLLARNAGATLSR